MEQDNAAGMLFVREEGDRKVINFFHVLLPCRGFGLEEKLLEFVLRDLGDWSGAIFTDFIPYYPIALDGVLSELGFSKIERQIMHRQPWKDHAQAPEGVILRTVDVKSLPEIADVLVESYARHSERFLFPEVQSHAEAETYLSRVHSGAFGNYHPDFGIGAWTGEVCVGFAIGSQVLPGLGFALHVAVRPDFQGRGLGQTLLGALATAIADEGLDYIALGVTCDNPAVFLYQRAGFECVAKVPVYHRS